MSYATERLRAALRARFGASGAVIMEEVSNGTGAHASRYADMVVMETWPSRGLEIHGIEIKVSRHDWMRERANPAKAEEIHRHCDFWWLAVERGVLAEGPNEVPSRWGILELTEDTTGNPRLVVVRGATREERPKEVSRLFVAAMLRAMVRKDADETERRIQDEVRKRVDAHREADRRARLDGADLAGKLLEKMRAEMGEDAVRWALTDDVLRAFSVVYKARLADGWDGICGLLSTVTDTEAKARDLRERMAKALEESGVSVPEHLASKLNMKRRRRRAA